MKCSYRQEKISGLNKIFKATAKAHPAQMVAKPAEAAAVINY